MQAKTLHEGNIPLDHRKKWPLAMPGDGTENVDGLCAIEGSWRRARFCFLEIR
jgi:hypothetical protein